MTPEQQMQLELEEAQAELELAQQSAPSQVGAGLLSRALGAGVPFGREGLLSAAAGIEALRGADYETARAIREQEMKQAMEAAATALPGASSVTELGMSLLQPGGVGNRLLKAMGISGLEGLLYGAAEETGTLPERLQKALPSAAVGAATVGAIPTLKQTAKGAQKLGKAGQMTAVGLTVRDIRKQPELADKFVKARDAGLFKGFSKKGEALAENLNEQVNKFEDLLEGTLREADAVSTPIYKPNFKTIEKELEAKYTGKELVAAKQHLAEQAALISERFDGTLSSLQAEKRKLYRSAYQNIENQSLKKTVDRLIGNKMKTTIEKGVDDLATSGKLDPSLVGSIKEANDVYGSVLSFGDPIDAKKATEQMTTIKDKIVSGLRTTGGFGSLIVSGATPLPLALLAWEGLENPSSRYLIGRGLEATGTGLQSALGTRLAEQLSRGGGQLAARSVANTGGMMTPIAPTSEQE
jgi:hypothetical protein